MVTTPGCLPRASDIGVANDLRGFTGGQSRLFLLLCSRGGPMTAPRGDGMSAGPAGCGHLRASHLDREHAVGMLKAAFVHGRLTKDEFDSRVGQALTARTYAELAALAA